MSLREYAQKVSLMSCSSLGICNCCVRYWLGGHLAILVLCFYVNTAAFEWQNPQKESDSLNTVGCFCFPKVLRV